MASYLPILLFVTLIASVSSCANHCKPMFTAITASNAPTRTNAVLKFSKIISQCGDGYNPATGMFTAVVPGFYGFAFSHRVEKKNSALYLVLEKNGVAFLSSVAGERENTDQSSSMAFIHLEKDDRVNVKAAYLVNNPLVSAYKYTTFSGWKV